MEAVLTGDVFLSQSEMLTLSRMDEKGRHDEIRKILRAASRKVKARYTIEDRKAEKQAEEANPIPLSIGIKEMPAFNPDMELQGLTLTMPTWMTAMDRAIRRSDLSLVTDEAKENLRAALFRLDGQIRATLEALS